MKALNIIYNVKLVEQVILFFKPADNHQETLTALMTVAGSTVEEFQAKTRIGLEYALEEHKTIDLTRALSRVTEHINAYINYHRTPARMSTSELVNGATNKFRGENPVSLVVFLALYFPVQ